MNMQQHADRLTRFLVWATTAILILLPFHAFFTTWLGSNFGHLDAWRIWKEIIIVLLVPPVAYLAWRTPRVHQWFKQSWLARLMLAYMLLTVLLGVSALITHRVDGAALIYGLLSNLRFLGFFVMMIIVAGQTSFFEEYWLKLVLGPAVIVIIFGLLQRLVLAPDFLRHFGYGPHTIPAYQTVDQKIEYRRIQSTLRGANPLGAYLVLVLTTAMSQLWRRRTRLVIIGLLLGGSVALGFTYSRSAWIGVGLALGIMPVWEHPHRRLRQWLLVVGLLFVTVAASGLTVAHHASRDQVLQNTFFHTDNTSKSAQSSNAGRVAAIKIAAKEVLHEPLGRGPGTAGPASFRNNHPPRIAENYFLQIGQETGWLGLALFVAINVLVGTELWRRRSDPLGLALLASLIGLTFVNLFSHAWGDDTLGLLWWGLAGIALALAPQKTAHQRSR